MSAVEQDQAPGRAPALTKGQVERRRRVIEVALELATQGGYDAVQMRDVAVRADVALGTIYRYFSSKDHLLAEAQLQWVRDLSQQVQARPPRAPTLAGRVVELLRRATRALEAKPQLAEALVTALVSNDPQAALCQRHISVEIGEVMAAAFPPDFDHQVREDIVRTLGHVWLSALVGWTNRWFGIGRAGDELELAAHLLLDQYG